MSDLQLLQGTLSQDLKDYGYRLVILPEMRSYAAQDETNKIIYLARARRGVPVSFQDMAWSGFHDLGHVVDARSDEEYVQDFRPTILLERGCDRFGCHEAIKFFDKHGLEHTLTPDSWKTARYSTPSHVAEWLEGFNRGQGFEKLDAEQVHAIADALHIPWDDDEAFMDVSEDVTGKRHLDDMKREELWLVVLAMVRHVLGREPEMIKESSGRVGITISPRVNGRWDQHLKRNEDRKEYKHVRVEGKDFLLQKQIPVLTQLPDHAGKAKAAIRQAIRSAPRTDWTHPQIAIPDTIKLTKQIQAFKGTRGHIRLPGEAMGSESFRAGRLHAHKVGPTWLVHEDKDAPGKTLKSLLTHTPEAVKSQIRRFTAKRPVITSEKIQRYSETPMMKAMFGKTAGKPKGIKILAVGDGMGGGHMAQAKNLAEAARRRNIPVEILNFDDAFGDPESVKKYYENYGKLLDAADGGKMIPTAYAGAVSGITHLKHHTIGFDRKKLHKWVDDNSDQAIVLTKTHLQMPFAGVKHPIHVMHTDPEKSVGVSDWDKLSPRIHVGTQAVMDVLKPRESKVLPGLAVNPQVLEKQRPSKLMSKRDYNVTVSGGTLGLEVDEITKRVLQSGLPPNAVVHAVAGKNEELQKKLTMMAKKDPRIRPHGYAPLTAMMQEADLNVIRAHGTTYAETEASGKPAVYYAPDSSMLDVQGGLTRDTALYGARTVKNPAAIGLDKIPGAVDLILSKPALFERRSKAIQKRVMRNSADMAVRAFMKSRKEYKAP